MNYKSKILILRFLKIDYILLCLLFSLSVINLTAQEIPSQKVIEVNELPKYLKADVRGLLEEGGVVTSNRLAAHFRDEFSKRFFYDYKSVEKRLINYNSLYGNQESHQKRALDHLNKYPDSTQWVLPFNYKNGEEVNAYALRHLARQHKMVDIALYYFQDNKDPSHIKYFENQMRSLNAALEHGKYEKIEDGNGVYEVFRAGYRIFNWLWIHNLFLNEEEYSDEDQLLTLATLLQHGKHLYERNDSFRPGNHQTKGMSSLAVLSILLRDFEGVDQWYERAMERLGEHLEKEINKDGFQFERSVHYHMSDIKNYFYVYQLAKINGISVDEKWEGKLRKLFTTLVKIAYPDKSAPVLQDDTEIPWAEKNDISGSMTLGYLLFDDPEFGYFASDMVDDRVYWYLSDSQVENLSKFERKAPTYGSIAFEDTHYYVMREGWKPNDKMMIISAGLDASKPDHQHGDMLGIQAIANSEIILPNYQVRYSLKDFELFKNSMVKNVALVDNELQGKQWTSNKGGSGFGKFKTLPKPKVIAWETNDKFDLFIGSHDGFETSGVDYSRQVIYVKDEFWIVKDNFRSDDIHDYKQVWQGHYTAEKKAELIRSSFSYAAGCDIYQLNAPDSFEMDGTRGKNWTVLTKSKESDFDFITIIYPYQNYNNRLDESVDKIQVGSWKINQSKWIMKGGNPHVFSTENQFIFFGISEIKRKKVAFKFSKVTDMYIEDRTDEYFLQVLGEEKVEVVFSNNGVSTQTITLLPGEKKAFRKR